MTEVLARSIDFESSSKADDWEVVEQGWTDITLYTETRECLISPPESMLWRPERGLAPEVVGIHHLTAARLADWPVCTEADLIALATANEPEFLVAHNASYEQQRLTKAITGDAHWICTMKCARRAWLDAPEYSLQTLRYWRGLELDNAFAMPPHRAGPDSYVGAALFAELAREHTINTLVQWTKLPLYYHTCPLKKHKGWAWEAVPRSYLDWILRDETMEFDLKYAAQLEINTRVERGQR
jgi:exodeoxyribonuclease X